MRLAACAGNDQPKIRHSKLSIAKLRREISNFLDQLNNVRMFNTPIEQKININSVFLETEGKNQYQDYWFCNQGKSVHLMLQGYPQNLPAIGKKGKGEKEMKIKTLHFS
jgi:hypothetical protein